MTHHDCASLQQATVVSYSAQMLSFGRIITAVPVAFRLPTFLCIVTNLEVHERYLPITTGRP